MASALSSSGAQTPPDAAALSGTQQPVAKFDAEFSKKKNAVEQALQRARTTFESPNNTRPAWDLWMEDIVPALKQLRMIAWQNPNDWRTTEKAVMDWVSEIANSFTPMQIAAYNAVLVEVGLLQSQEAPSTSAAVVTTNPMQVAQFTSDVEGTFSFSDD